MIIIVLIYFFLGYILSEIFERSTKKWAMWDKKIGWQIHHSVFGLAAFLLAVLFPDYFLELTSLGIGIIVQHYKSDGWVFIRRW